MIIIILYIFVLICHGNKFIISECSDSMPSWYAPCRHSYAEEVIPVPKVLDILRYALNKTSPHSTVEITYKWEL